MAAGFPICHSTATYRRDAALEVGGFDASRQSRIDFELWLRMSIAGGVVENLPHVLAIHTKRPGTYFDRRFSKKRSALEMAELNFRAVKGLQLGPRGYLLAVARLGYSMLRRQSIKGTPRYGESLPELPTSYSQLVSVERG